MSVLKKFCFCGSLKTGGMIIGMIEMVNSVAIGIGTQIYLLNPSFETESSVQFILHITLIVCVISLLVSFLLMLGIVKENLSMLLLWLATHVLGLVCLGFYVTMDIKSSYKKLYDITRMKNLTIKLVAFGIAIFFWLCIFSLYQVLKNKISDNNLTRKRIKDQPNLGRPPYYSEYI